MTDTRSCRTCRHRHNSVALEPCKSCDYDSDTPSRWAKIRNSDRLRHEMAELLDDCEVLYADYDDPDYKTIDVLKRLVKATASLTDESAKRMDAEEK